MSTLKFLLFLSFLIVAANDKTYAQKTSFIGLKFNIETTSSNFKPGLGVLFERRITRRSGVETGVYYRNYIQNGSITYIDSTGSRSYSFIVSERHLSIPVLYKLYTRILNLSVGPTFDFYLGWKQKNTTPLLKVDAYNIDPNLSIGLLTKVSRKINLNKQFALEPELYFNPILTSGRYYVGIGIAGKYQLE